MKKACAPVSSNELKGYVYEETGLEDIIISNLSLVVSLRT